MSTTITFAGNLADVPELRCNQESKPVVTCRVLVDRRMQNAQGDCVIDELIAPSVKTFNSAATQVHDSCGWADPVLVDGLKRTGSWPDEGTGEKRIKDVVVIDNRFGAVGPSHRYVSARIGGVPHAAQTR